MSKHSGTGIRHLKDTKEMFPELDETGVLVYALAEVISMDILKIKAAKLDLDKELINSRVLLLGLSAIAEYVNKKDGRRWIMCASIVDTLEKYEFIKKDREK